MTTLHVSTTPPDLTMPTDEITTQTATINPTSVEIDSTAATAPDLIQSADDVRNSLIKLGISEKDIADASTWARQLKE